MAQKCFPFNSASGDRVYKAEDFRQYFAQFIGNGVFYNTASSLRVTENDGMKVQVAAGAAWVDGAGYINDSALSITLANADGALSRIDRIVVRCSYAERNAYIDVLQGQYSAAPVAPNITRNADRYELALADVLVAAGVTSITQAAITDLRLNTALCGIVTGLITQADTTDIFNQFESYLEQFKAQYIADIEDWTKTEESSFNDWQATKKNAFLDWVAEIHDILDEKAAGKLLNRIEAEAKKAFERHYGMINSTTEFLPNGNIETTNSEGTILTSFGTDISGNKTITEVLTPAAAVSSTYTKVTTIIPATGSSNKTIREEYTEA